MARRLGTLPAVLLAGLAATGWLYLAQPSAPGPRVADALPLDELARHASTPLLWYLAVWSGAGVALGLYARWARIERATAALTLGLGTAFLTYLEVGLSLAVVRQVSLRAALDEAARRESIYVPAVIVAVCAALLATPQAHVRRAPFLVATVVAIGGFLNLLHAVLPGDDEGLLHSLTPDAVGPLARAAGVVSAVALLVAARGLARRRRRAWQVAVTVAAASAALHVLYGLNDGTLAAAVVLALLVARRHDFAGPGDTSTRSRIASRIVLCVTVIVAYATAALGLNRMAADQPFTLGFAVRESLRGLVALDVRGSPHLAGPFGSWFPLSLLLLAVLSTAWLVAGWLAPWRHQVVQLERERQLALDLVRTWGADTLAPFVLRADKSYFFAPRNSAFLAYRVVGGVAIVSGDPVGPPEEFGPLVARFVAHAHVHDWRVAILGASERCLPLYAEHGLHALYHGDEAIVETADFALEGRAIRKVRQSVSRLQQAGYAARVLAPSEIDGTLRRGLEDVADAWRDGEPERGFVMALDTLFGLGDEDAVFVVGFAPDGTAAGFLHFALSRASGALSLSSMPRLRSTPNGFNEWLICATIEWARMNGFGRVS
ncbi:MAG: phosphatidylglycerol lysyltransferase domain-containing protein, partial [Actinomycetota bacterium]